MIKYIYILVFSTLALNLMGQRANKSFSEGLGAADYSFNVGSQVGSAFNGGYYLSNYFSPSASFDLTKKFSLVVGVGVNYTQVNNMQMYVNEYNTERINLAQTSFFAYASGIYKLSPKVNLNATLLSEEALLNSSETPMAYSKKYNDVSLGVNYNVTRNFSINAQMHYSDRPYNGFTNPHSNFGGISPFARSPFF